VNTTRGAFKIHDINLSLTERKPVADIQCTQNNLMSYCNAMASYDPKGSALSFTFNYSDGFSETNANGISTHAFINAGLYSVEVVVTDEGGLSSRSITQVQAVTPPNSLPVANLNCQSSRPKTLSCNAGPSNDIDGFILNAHYLYDDGFEVSYDKDFYFDHTFSIGGNHKVTLTVTDNDGGVHTIEKNYLILENQNPVANFECSNSSPQKLSCYSTSTDPDSGDLPIYFNWNFGDGEAQSGLASGFSHTYGENPTYKVSLTVTDQYGGSSTLEKEISMLENQAPIANPNCFASLANTYQCNANAYDPDGSIVSQSWSINGATLSGSSILYDFTNGGDFPVVLTVTDDLGKITTSNLMIHVDKPIVDFLCNETSPFKIACQYVKPINETRNIISFRYIIDNREVYEGESFVHDFLVAGEHRITLTLYSDDDTNATIEKKIIINKVHLAPVASFVSFADIGLKVKFDANESYKQGRKVMSFRWDFGDGTITTSAEDKISHTFQNVGSYNISLLVTDNLGNTNLNSKVVYVYESEVSDPGEVNSDTVEGIDFNNDGIRDDVERWINYEAKENLELKTILRKLAEKYQFQIVNSSDIEKSKNTEIQKEKIVTCLLGKNNNDELTAYYQKMFQYLYTSTELRSEAWSIIQGNLGGTSSVVPPVDQVTRLLSCEGI
jgi:PKD repeat protein